MCVMLEIMSVIFGGLHYYMTYKTNGSLKRECPDGYVFSNIINKGCAEDTVVPIFLILPSVMFHVFCQNTVTPFELTFRLRVKSCCLYFLNLKCFTHFGDIINKVRAFICYHSSRNFVLQISLSNKFSRHCQRPADVLLGQLQICLNKTGMLKHTYSHSLFLLGVPLHLSKLSEMGVQLC